MIRWLSLASLFVLLVAAEARAQVTCDEKQPEHCSAPVVEGQPSPLTGQVLTTDAAISLGQKADGCEVLRALDVDREKQLSKVQVKLERQLRKAEVDGLKLENQILQEHLKEATSRPFWEETWFVASVTVVITVGAYTLAVWGAGQLR